VVLSRQFRNQPSKRRHYGNLLPHSQAARSGPRPTRRA
jgi:hypothetical protein